MRACEYLCTAHCSEVLLKKQQKKTLVCQVSSFMRSESTQPPLFYWFLEMENKFCCISTTTMSLLLLSVQYPDSVSRLSPLALTSPEWDSGFWMIKVVLSCCFLFNNLVYIEPLLFSSCSLSLVFASSCLARSPECVFAFQTYDFEG